MTDAKLLMEKMKQEEEEARRQQRKDWLNHDPARVEGMVVVDFDPPGVDPATLESHERLRLWVPSAINQASLEVGYVALTADTDRLVLRLDKILVFHFAGGCGVGTSAMVRLRESARAAGYRSIRGLASPETPQDAVRLREWYRKLGYEVDFGGERDALHLDLWKGASEAT
jgi:hypothetical protein